MKLLCLLIIRHVTFIRQMVGDFEFTSAKEMKTAHEYDMKTFQMIKPLQDFISFKQKMLSYIAEYINILFNFTETYIFIVAMKTEPKGNRSLNVRLLIVSQKGNKAINFSEDITIKT